MASFTLKTEMILNTEPVLTELSGKDKKFEFAGLKSSLKNIIKKSKNDSVLVPKIL